LTTKNTLPDETQLFALTPDQSWDRLPVTKGVAVSKSSAKGKVQGSISLVETHSHRSAFNTVQLALSEELAA